MTILYSMISDNDKISWFLFLLYQILLKQQLILGIIIIIIILIGRLKMNKTVLITGASRGIGKAIAFAFAQKNYNIIINYNHSEPEAISVLKEFEKINVNAIAVKADVSNRNQVDVMVRKAIDNFGNIDILVNNAGIAQQILFNDISESMWDNMFNINVKGVFNCTQAVLPYMIHNKSGKIINISSMWGISGASCEVHYSASKAAVIGFTKALAKEVGLSGINVNCIAPGVIKTDMNNNCLKETLIDLKNETPLNRIGTPENVADAAVFLASEAAGFITGQVLSVDGGLII